MKIKINKVFKLKLKGDDVSKFKSVISKLTSDSNAVGFKRDLLTEDEQKFLTQLNNCINKSIS